MSVARFIADQRTKYQVPHVIVCALLGVSLAWFYKWWARAQSPAASNGLHTDRARRRNSVDRAVTVAFSKARGLHGSPRLVHDLRDDGWTVSEKTVAESMRRQGLVARRIRRRNGLTRQDKTKAPFPDLLKRDFTAPRQDTRVASLGSASPWAGSDLLRQCRRGALFSSLAWEVLSRHDFTATGQAQAVVLGWCYRFYNHDRRHSSANMMSPINYENAAAPNWEAA